MTAASRANVASSFTVVKGALVDETYAVFADWDFTQSKRANLDRLREENFIGASSATWLRDVAKVINRRFEPAGRDRPLVLLAKGGCDIDTWKPLMLWHMTRDEFLVRDFLVTWLFPAYDAGAYRVRPDQLHDYLRTIGTHGGSTEHAWTDATVARVAAGLLKMATAFGILTGSMAKEFGSYHLPDSSFMYLLHAMRDDSQSPRKVIDSPDWRMFMMRPADVERELLRLHQFRAVEYEVAGSLVQLKLPCRTASEYAQRMVA